MEAAPSPRQTFRSPDIPAIAAIVRAGGVIAYPTEAVFGIGCRPADAAACERVLDLKGREAGKGLIVITDELARIACWLEPLPEALQARAEASWPGPHTWLWPARASCPPWLRGSHTRLAVRVTANPTVRALCAAAGTALVSTSANRSGEPPCRDAACVETLFAGRIDGILDRPCGGLDQPSTIRDIVTGDWLRGAPDGKQGTRP
jgi:L-threonylcarbamoyladenylate synthase